jgi:hypothetical protein
MILKLDIFLLISLIFLNKDGVLSKQICYEGYGCFIDTFPFGGTAQRPLAFLPQSPDKINTTFTLYNRNNLRGLVNSKNVFFTKLIPTFKTKFIIHGFLNNEMEPWVLKMKDTLIEYDNVNVITVDWSDGCGFPYTQATANTQIVGVEIAKLIQVLVKQQNIKLNDIHLIGRLLINNIIFRGSFNKNK